MQPEQNRRKRPGRPRKNTMAEENVVRSQILDHAGRLFVRFGYTGTSTRDIAHAVGVTQSGLFYHFRNKQEILTTLLELSIAPTLQYAQELLSCFAISTATIGDEIERVTPGQAYEMLDALLHHDTGMLAAINYNLGALYSLPEVRYGRGMCRHFVQSRTQLRTIYGTLACYCRGGAWGSQEVLLMGTAVLSVVESIVVLRAENDSGHEGQTHDEITAQEQGSADIAHQIARIALSVVGSRECAN